MSARASTSSEQAPAPLLSFATLFTSPLLSVRSYHCRACRGGFGSEEHTDGHCMVLLRRGFFTKQVGSRSVTADVGQAVFHTGGSVYRVSHPSDCGDQGTVLSLAPSVLNDVIRDLHPGIDDAPERPFPSLTTHCDTSHYWLHRSLIQALEGASAPQCEPLWVETTALQLQAAILRDAYRVCSPANTAAANRSRRSRTDAAHRDRIEAARTVLSRRLGESLSLADVADEVHLSPFHLARLFRHHTGVTLHRYLTQLRLRAAFDRVLEQPCDLAALAIELGFSSHSHLTDLFRREFGCAPSALRQQPLHKVSKNLKAAVTTSR